MAESPALVVCDNPAIALTAPDGALAAFLSAWRVTWSPHGSGTLVAFHDGTRLRVWHEDEALARWIVTTFVRHFAELVDVDTTEPEYAPASIRIALDPTVGADLIVDADGVLLEAAWGQVGEPVVCDYDDVMLGEGTYRLRNATVECTQAQVALNGEQIAGSPGRAFLAVAETWTQSLSSLGSTSLDIESSVAPDASISERTTA